MVTMNLLRNSYLKKALLVIALSYLGYNLYQASVTSIFISHFLLIVERLPSHIVSSQPTLQLALFLSQEVFASIGVYLRLVAGFLAFYSAVLFAKKDKRYIDNLGKVLLFESLYFVLLIPSAANHIVGSFFSSSELLNGYTGISFLVQAALIFPTLFILSRKISKHQNQSSILKWATIAAPLYVLGFWVRNWFLWVYALSPSANPQAGFPEMVGFVDSWLTLLIAAIVTAVACLVFWQKKKLIRRPFAAAVTLFGVYFVIYDVVSIWVPIFRAFLQLTDFWIITLPILGIALLLGKEPNGS